MRAAHARGQADVLTRREAAQRLGVSQATLGGWIASGALTVVGRNPRGRRGTIRPAGLATAHERANAGGVVPLRRHDPARAAARQRALREATGRNQQRLAAEAGLTPAAVSRLEVGRVSPLGPRRSAKSPGRWGWPRSASWRTIR